MTQAPFYLEKINQLPGVHADFVGRIPEVLVDTDKEATVARLQPAHQSAVSSLGFEWSQLHRAEQTHGTEIAMVGKDDLPQTWPVVDGLITDQAGILLGIHVADCGAVYIVDPIKNALALLHSGKKGTEGNITGRAIAMMQEKFGSQPADLHVALAPCIRPPVYEVNFAEQIRLQALDAGVPESHFTDSGICTSSDLDAYYSYRIEKGSTGRMLALLGVDGATTAALSD